MKIEQDFIDKMWYNIIMEKLSLVLYSLRLAIAPIVGVNVQCTVCPRSPVHSYKDT